MNGLSKSSLMLLSGLTEVHLHCCSNKPGRPWVACLGGVWASALVFGVSSARTEESHFSWACAGCLGSVSTSY